MTSAVVATGPDVVAVTLEGTGSANVVVGSGGAFRGRQRRQQHLQGGTNDDVLSAGVLGGNHFITSGGGSDSLYGGFGRDTLVGGSGNSVLVAGSGRNVLFGGSGQDTLYGGGQSELHAGSNGSTLAGGYSPGASDSCTVARATISWRSRRATTCSR